MIGAIKRILLAVVLAPLLFASGAHATGSWVAQGPADAIWWNNVYMNLPSGLDWSQTQAMTVNTDEGPREACAVVAGQLMCWGASGAALTPPAAAQSGATDVQMNIRWRGDGHAICATANGGVYCWGDTTSGAYSANPIPAGSGATRIALGWDHGCALVNDGVRCWGNAPFTAVPAAAQSGVSTIAAEAYGTCYVKTDGTLGCFGSMDGWGMPTSGSYTQVAVGRAFACAVKDDASVVCWGPQAITPPAGAKLQWIVARENGACGETIDNQMVCWGSPSQGTSPYPDAATYSAAVPFAVGDIVVGATNASVPDFIPPSIKILVKGTAISGTSFSASAMSDVTVQIVDNKPGPYSATIGFAGGNLSSASSSDKSGITASGVSLSEFAAPAMLPSAAVGAYTLTVVARDARGLSTTMTYQLNFAPPTVARGNGSGTLPVPAMDQVFYDKSGLPALYSAVLTANGTSVTGSHGLVAKLASTATMSVNVNGTTIAPGATVDLGGYDFTASGGRIVLPMKPVGGVVGTGELWIATAVTGAPVFDVNISSWTPSVTVGSAPTVKAVWDAVSLGVTLGGGCSLASTLSEVQSASIFATPKCLVQWTGLLDGLTATSSGLSGHAYSASGTYTLGYSATVYNNTAGNTDASKFASIAIGSGSTTITVQDPGAGQSIKLNPVVNGVVVGVTSMSAGLTRDSGPNCSMKRAASDAQAASATGAIGCVLALTSTPNGLTDDTTKGLPWLTGVPTDDTPTIGWSLTAVGPGGTTVAIGSGSIVIPSTAPTPPTIVLGKAVPAAGYFTAAPDGGTIVAYGVEALQTPVHVEVLRGTDVIADETVQPGGPGNTFSFNRTLSADTTALWDDTSYTIRASLARVPTVKTEKPVRVVTVPSDDVEVSLTMPVTSVSSSTVVEADAQLAGGAGTVYDVNTMGAWRVRVIQVQGSNLTELGAAAAADLTGAAKISTTFTAAVGPTFTIAAEATLVSPIAGYTKTVRSSLVGMSLVQGGQVEATLSSRKMAGKAPLTTAIDLAITDRNKRNSLGNVIWEVSSDGGATWTARTAGASPARLSTTFDEGVYKVRAKTYNKNDQTEFTTTSLDIVAADILTATLEGNAVALTGSETYLTVAAKSNGTLVSSNDLSVKWSYDLGSTWVDGQVATEVPTTPAKVPVWARVKKASAADVPLAWTEVRGKVTWVAVRPPSVRIGGPRQVEVGVANRFTAVMSEPYAGMVLDMTGFWTLPDGTKVDGTTLDYTPPESLIPTDGTAPQRVTLHFTAQIVGYEDKGGTAVIDYVTTPWQYQWPDFVVTKAISIAMAPADVLVRAWPLATRSDIDRLTNLTYEWTLPNGAVVYTKSGQTTDQALTQDRVSFRVTEPGSYNVSVAVHDDRGHSGTATTSFDIVDAPDANATFTIRTSNSYLRAPLTVNLRPSISGGHPRDRVSTIDWTVDGTAVESRAGNGSATLAEGDHTIGMTINTTFGKVLTAEKTLTVIANTPPTCTIQNSENTSRWTLTANCTDSDGKVTALQWTVNGNVLSTSPRSLTISKSDATNLTVSVVAIDDSGATSTPVSWSPSP